jgi:hypothetical protein
MLFYKVYALVDGSAEPGIVPYIKSQTGAAYLSKAKIAYHIFNGAGHPGTVFDYTLHNRISKSAYLVHKPNISEFFHHKDTYMVRWVKIKGIYGHTE